mgnify:CR=1 FL=1
MVTGDVGEVDDSDLGLDASFLKPIGSKGDTLTAQMDLEGTLALLQQQLAAAGVTRMVLASTSGTIGVSVRRACSQAARSAGSRAASAPTGESAQVALLN